MSSVRMEQLGSQYTDFDDISYLRIFRKSVEKIQVSLKSDNNKEVHYMKTFSHLWLHLAKFFTEWETWPARSLETPKLDVSGPK